MAVALPLLLVALLPAAASAKPFSPELDVAVTPSTPNQPARIVTTVLQGSDEVAAQKVQVTIPEGFGVPVATLTGLPVCTAPQAAGHACDEATRIGSAEATASVLFGLLNVPAAGTVNWGGATADGRFTIYVFLDNDTFGQHLLVTGTIEPAPTGGFMTTFDDLPDLLTTRFALTFDGGAKALLLTPATCGSFRFRGVFTSHEQQLVERFAPVTISGCPSPATTLGTVRLSRTRLRFSVTTPAVVRARVFSFRTRRTVMDERVNARGGAVSLRLKRALRPGRYRVTLTASADGATTVRKRTTVTIRRR